MLTLSVARDILGLTDAYLTGLGFITPEAIQAERSRRFREEMAKHLVTDSAGERIVYRFATNLQPNGALAKALKLGYENYWLLKLSMLGKPVSSNTGVTVNLVAPDQDHLHYRKVILVHGDTLHMKGQDGCIYNYSLRAPAFMLRLPSWNPAEPSDKVSGEVNALINTPIVETEEPYRQQHFHTNAFYRRALSATYWEITVYLVSPSAGLPDMELSSLDDIELKLSVSYAATGKPTSDITTPSMCARGDW
ncbi:MAG: hypothetical protein EOM24_31200 [Chloroflexia bacterium]|nr:hypothetical protein [Chloroflexia bacterium]